MGVQLNCNTDICHLISYDISGILIIWDMKVTDPSTGYKIIYNGETAPPNVPIQTIVFNTEVEQKLITYGHNGEMKWYTYRVSPFYFALKQSINAHDKPMIITVVQDKTWN
jgi:hypothetical protein